MVAVVDLDVGAVLGPDLHVRHPRSFLQAGLGASCVASNADRSACVKCGTTNSRGRRLAGRASDGWTGRASIWSADGVETLALPGRKQASTHESATLPHVV